MPMALEGIKVIDVSQVAAVPMCARHLADYGADVIHVENTETGDSWRSLQAGHGDGPAGIPSDIPYNWETFNRNKKSLSINLYTKEGQEIIHRLVVELPALGLEVGSVVAPDLGALVPVDPEPPQILKETHRGGIGRSLLISILDP